MVDPAARNDYDNKRFDRVLNGPTSTQWLDPWVEHLRAQGVTFQVGQSLSRLTPGGRHIASATVVDANGVPQQVSADWYISVVPCEKLAAVLTHDDGGCQRGWARATPPTVYCTPLGIPVRWSRSSNCSRRRGGQDGRPGALPRPATRARRRRHPLAFALVCPRWQLLQQTQKTCRVE